MSTFFKVQTDQNHRNAVVLAVDPRVRIVEGLIPLKL